MDIVKNAGCDVYHDLKHFIKKDRNKCDIIVIDYDTTKTVGLEIAFLEYFYNTRIICVTSKSLVHFERDYKLRTRSNNLYFIYREDLAKELEKSSYEVLCMNRLVSITVKMNKNLYKLYFYEIYAIYSEGHYLIFMILDEKEPIRVRMKMQEIYYKMIENGFVRARSSMFVNIHNIKRVDYDNDTIYFTNGEHEIFKRQYYKEIRRRFLEEI